MRYRELLELYRKKELGEQEREMIEQEIEKHEAISEYLFEREESDTLNFGADGVYRWIEPFDAGYIRLSQLSRRDFAALKHRRKAHYSAAHFTTLFTAK